VVSAGPGRKDAACGGTPQVGGVSAYPDLSTAKRQKHRQTTKEVKERKATKEAIRAAKEKLSSTGLFEEAFDLADSLARNADSYSNRLESSLYGGSNRSVGVQNSSKHALVRGAVSVDTL
jgi:hypothetical protein